MRSALENLSKDIHVSTSTIPPADCNISRPYLFFRTPGPTQKGKFFDKEGRTYGLGIESHFPGDGTEYDNGEDLYFMYTPHPYAALGLSRIVSE